MNRKLVLLILFVFPFVVSAQEQPNFAERCLGNWEGILYIYQQGQLQDSVSVSLEVDKTANPKVYTWVTTYNSEEHPMVKDYLLKVGKEQERQYIMEEDENTEILMYGFDDKIYSMFETQNTMLTSTYELRNDTLYFEVNSATHQASGAQVSSFNIGYLQKVAFTRRNE